MNVACFSSVTLLVPSPIYGTDTSNHLRLRSSENSGCYREILRVLGMAPYGVDSVTAVEMIRGVMSNDISIGSLPWSSGVKDFLSEWRKFELAFARNRSSYVNHGFGYLSGVNLTNSNTRSSITIVQLNHGELE